MTSIRRCHHTLYLVILIFLLATVIVRQGASHFLVSGHLPIEAKNGEPPPHR